MTIIIFLKKEDLLLGMLIDQNLGENITKDLG